VLVLSRNTNESLVITTPDGYVIDVMVCDVRGNGVRLGIQVDKAVQVWRQEVYDEIKRQEYEAKYPKNP
jgi:carbon storage regulator